MPSEQHVPGWQPIETAPKNGTKILVWTVHEDIELSEWHEVPDVRFEPVGDGLFRQVVKAGFGGWNSNTFTHWMPLPKPPHD